MMLDVHRMEDALGHETCVLLPMISSSNRGISHRVPLMNQSKDMLA